MAPLLLPSNPPDAFHSRLTWHLLISIGRDGDFLTYREGTKVGRLFRKSSRCCPPVTGGGQVLFEIDGEGGQGYRSVFYENSP